MILNWLDNLNPKILLTDNERLALADRSNLKGFLKLEYKIPIIEILYEAFGEKDKDKYSTIIHLNAEEKQFSNLCNGFTNKLDYLGLTQFITYKSSTRLIIEYRGRKTDIISFTHKKAMSGSGVYVCGISFNLIIINNPDQVEREVLRNIVFPNLYTLPKSRAIGLMEKPEELNPIFRIRYEL